MAKKQYYHYLPIGRPFCVCGRPATVAKYPGWRRWQCYCNHCGLFAESRIKRDAVARFLAKSWNEQGDIR